jgi:hypothetical protein
MNRILLALAILAAGTVGSLTAHYSTSKLRRAASATHESWVVQTQDLAAARVERERLAERIRELKQSLRQAEATGHQNGLWSALETNRIGHLAPDLREHLLEELGFSWNSSDAFIVVSKETVRLMRNSQTGLIRQGKLIDSVAALLALTPQERSQIETAMERVQADLKDWAISHTERSEPRDDMLAQYTLQSTPPTSLTNHFTEAFSAIGKERTELMMIGSWQDLYTGSIPHWMSDAGMSDKPLRMTLKRISDGDIQVLKAQDFTSNGPKQQEDDVAPWKQISKLNFPSAFRPLFPNGWADLAEREEFELPEELQQK